MSVWGGAVVTTGGPPSRLLSIRNPLLVTRLTRVRDLLLVNTCRGGGAEARDEKLGQRSSWKVTTALVKLDL